MKKQFENMISFVCGSSLGVESLNVAMPDWWDSVEISLIKTLFFAFAAIAGGALGLLGQKLAQKYFFDKYFKILVIGILLSGIWGCAPKIIQSGVITTKTDTTTIRVDTAYQNVYIPADTLVYYTEVDCPDGKKPLPLAQTVQGKHSTASIALQNGQLKVDVNVKELRDSVLILTQKINHYQTTSVNEQKVQQVPFVPKAYKIYEAIVWIEVGILVLFLIGLAIRIYLKSQISFK